MAPSVTGVNQFSQCSITQMQPEIAAAGCLTPIGAPDLRVTIAEPTRNVFAGVSFSYALTVTNLGVEPATASSLTSTVGGSLELLGATAGAVTCNVAGQSATCDLGTIGGGSSQGVSLMLRAPAVGTFSVNANAAAATDADSSNNTTSGTVVASPAVDLVLSAAAASVQTEQQTTVVAQIDNAADFAATAVTITANVTAGLRPDQATVGGASCSTVGQAISCPLQTVPARGTLALTFTVTGLTAGNAQIAMSATASEAELNPGNNNLAAAVSVTSPSPQDGGGGALSWLAVAALAAAAARRTGRRAS
jgi:hypothetical protein